MLKKIEISNFKCFEQIKISGFERVNLIGGKNNAGKTALLEKIFLGIDHETPVIPSFVLTGELTEFSSDSLDISGGMLKVFQVIDRTINFIEVKRFPDGNFTLFLKREEGEKLPISLYGGAIKRVAEIFLRATNNKYKILLIDEIENGIHYTSQRNLWRVLFRLAVELDVQIFATTHSLEILQAFADVGLELEQECSSAYFELARKLKTNQIIGSRLDLETLNYALEHEKGVRGE